MTYELSLPIPSNHGSIEKYIHTVNNIPMLSAKEEYDLAMKLKNFGNLEAAKKLILSHLRLVVSIAKAYSGYGLNQADLIQEGNIGLMKAVKKFDPQKGVRLFSFAIYWIKAEIHEFILKNWRLVKIATTKPQRKLFFNIRKLKKTSSSLSPKEADTIAKDLGVKAKDVLEMEQRMLGNDVPLLSQDDNNNEDNYAPIDWLADNKYEPMLQIEQKNEYNLQTEKLQQALSLLDDRSKDIVINRWLNDEKNMTLQELSNKYNISAERVRQIESKAMNTMKDYLNTYIK